MIAPAALARRLNQPAGVAEATLADLIPFDEAYRLHAGGVYRFCLSQVRNPAIAEDLAADTFTAAWAAYERVHPDGDGVRPWLFRIARNATIDHGRRRNRGLRALGLLRNSSPRAQNVEAEVELRAELRAVLAAIAGLGARDRVLIGLRIAAGLSFADIAAIIGTTETAARTASHRALERVRAQVETNHD